MSEVRERPHARSNLHPYSITSSAQQFTGTSGLDRHRGLEIDHELRVGRAFAFIGRLRLIDQLPDRPTRFATFACSAANAVRGARVLDHLVRVAKLKD